MKTKESVESVAHPMGLTKHHLWLGNDCWIWCVASDVDEWGRLSIIPENDWSIEGPEWLDYELDMMGSSLAETLVIADVETELMHQGVAPDQPFLVRLHFRSVCYPATPNGPEEYDTEIDWAIVAAQPLPPEESACRWETLYGRKYLMSGLP